MRQTLVPAHPKWPVGLREMGGIPPPRRLRVEGAPVPSWDRCVALVGTRRPTSAGLEAARSIATQLVQAGYAIVSGLAVGIDAAAHEAALDAAGHTVAVLGCGLDLVYPRCNAALKERIRERGTLVSEYDDGVRSRSFHFPQRNRIIAALATAVVVVEGSYKSGALITARLALEANRDVYAVPGSIRNPAAEGPNELIRRGQAALVTCAEHIFEHLAPELAWDPAASGTAGPSVDEEERAVLVAMDDVGTAPDRICRLIGKPPGLVALTLARLEVRGLVVKRVSGYELTEGGARARRALV
ncbi:MAG TPA: DNA-processing protein DprA [Actinomycetota bacterium]|nr:DNA-processing protein DprA [Actinomycetota bacterium]